MLAIVRGKSSMAPAAATIELAAYSCDIDTVYSHCFGAAPLTRMKKCYALTDGGRMSPPDSPQDASTTYMSIISEQTFRGYWRLSEQLAQLLCRSLEQLRASNPLKSEDIWATIVVLSLLSVKYAERKQEWEMIETKATQWLQAQNLEGHTVDELRKLAAQALSDAADNN